MPGQKLLTSQLPTMIEMNALAFLIFGPLNFDIFELSVTFPERGAVALYQATCINGNGLPIWAAWLGELRIGGLLQAGIFWKRGWSTFIGLGALWLGDFQNCECLGASHPGPFSIRCKRLDTKIYDFDAISIRCVCTYIFVFSSNISICVRIVYI